MTLSGEIAHIVVIGAGLSGLTTAYELKRRGLGARILDKDEYIGASWRRRHPQLSLNTHRSVSHMPGLNYKHGTPAFPGRDAVAEHLRDFVVANDLQVEHSVSVQAISRRDGIFHLNTSTGVIRTRHLVVAVGRDGIPLVPSFTGQEFFRGQSLHAAELGSTEQYKGKRVLIVGGGNSGFDVANHLAKIDLAECWLSVRTGSAVLPKRLYRIAVHRLAPLMDRLPTRLADIAIAGAQHLAFGDLTKLGFPPAPQGAATRLAREHIAIPVDDGAIRAVRQGKIKIVKEVSALDAFGCVWHADGTQTSPDVIVYATGYSSAHSQILNGVTDWKVGRHASQGQMQTGLWSVGMTPGLVSYFHSARKEAILIADQIEAL